MAIVGGGPSAGYLLRWLAARAPCRPLAGRLAVTVIERSQGFGAGWVYDERTVLPVHTLAANELRTRIGKGRELATGFRTHVKELRRAGIAVDLRPGTCVHDVRRTGRRFVLELDGGGRLAADSVVLCTGHWTCRSGWDGLPNYVASPWPAAALQSRAAAGMRIGLIGSSHTAVDAALTLALGAGRFRCRDDRLVYQSDRPLHITMMSRGGYLPRVSGFGITTNMGEPEAAVKYRRSLTRERLEALHRDGGGRLRLQSVFDLLMGEAPFADALQRRRRAAAVEAPGIAAGLAALQARMTRLAGDRLFRRDVARAGISIARRRYLPWQSVLWEKTNLFRAHFHALWGEDRQLYDRFETLLLAFQRPLNFKNATLLAALFEAGVVRLERLGPAASAIAEAAGRFDLLVDCTGQGRHITATTDPLLLTLQRRRLIQPCLIPFMDPETAGRAFYQPGGIHLNPQTMEAIPAGLTDRSWRGKPPRLFVLGPAMLGQYPISDGLHALHQVAVHIVDEIVAAATVDEQDLPIASGGMSAAGA